MMHASGWAATFLTQHPILLDELLDDRGRNAELVAAGRRPRTQLDAAAGDTERQLDILREAHHAQLFRLLALDLAGDLSVERLADHLSALADTIVAAAIRRAWLTMATRHREVPRFAVIAYGKLGGKELGYVSDLDVIFLFDDDDQEGAGPLRQAGAALHHLDDHAYGGRHPVRHRHRAAPGRRQRHAGVLAAAFERYQQHSAWVWEHQALTRARFCAGDAAIGARFEAIREAVLRQDRSAAPPSCAGGAEHAQAHARRPSQPTATCST
jgi:glutamate-ammonia-ligase adenylyltransferase